MEWQAYRAWRRGLAAVIVIYKVNLDLNGFKTVLRPFMPVRDKWECKEGIAWRRSVVILFVRRT